MDMVQITTTFLKRACPVPFDEGQLWKGDNAQHLQEQLRSGFHDITRVMDCVGCEKCKLWGKLQLLGEAEPRLRSHVASSALEQRR